MAETTAGTPPTGDPNADALIALLPPTVDSFTYLTLIETTLPQNPERLATLHDVLLNHPSLTKTIGWDLVKVLLPLVEVEGTNHAAANARRCLDDVARLGNPREVILSVCENLVKLAPHDHDEIEHVDDSLSSTSFRQRFVALLEMLPILHMRLKALTPSRFVANTLHAALSAYHAFPTPEATHAMLAFLRSVSGVAPKEKPSLPPRTPSESPVSAATRAAPSGPDPEADQPSSNDQEKAKEDEALAQDNRFIHRLTQFALVEVLKIFAADFTSDDGEHDVEPLRWAGRLVENTKATEDSQPRHPGLMSLSPSLKQRYAVVEKLVTLSSDLHISDAELLRIVLRPSSEQLPPLDFDELPQTAEAIPFERHGALVLLAARASTRAISPRPDPSAATEKPQPIRILPDLAVIFSNFSDEFEDTDAPGQQGILVDSLLSLLLISMAGDNPVTSPSEREEIQQPVPTQFLRHITMCIHAPLYRDRSIMKGVSYLAFKTLITTDAERFEFLRNLFQQTHDVSEAFSFFMQENALDWLKQEIIDADIPPATLKTTIAAIYSRENVPPQLLGLPLLPARERGGDWMLALRLGAVQTCLVALNLYVFLIRSRKLNEKVDIRTAVHEEVAKNYLEPLKHSMEVICHGGGDDDDDEKSGAPEQVGQGAAELALYLIGEIEAWADETHD